MCRLYNVFANIYTLYLTFQNIKTIFLHSIKSYQYKGAVVERERERTGGSTRKKSSACVINHKGAAGGRQQA